MAEGKTTASTVLLHPEDEAQGQQGRADERDRSATGSGAFGEDHPPGPLALAPRHPGDAPFVNLLAIFENSGGYLAEAKREVQCSAVRQLQGLEQVYRSLLEQAQGIVAAARRDLKLHDLPVQATKIRGTHYYLYRREDRLPPLFFSILGPADYQQADPRACYLGCYRLNEDSSWSLVEGDGEEPWLRAAERQRRGTSDAQ